MMVHDDRVANTCTRPARAAFNIGLSFLSAALAAVREQICLNDYLSNKAAAVAAAAAKPKQT